MKKEPVVLVITGFFCIFVYMKEIELLPVSSGHYPDYYDEITDYVYRFAEKHFPLHQENYYCHIHSAAYEAFNRKYIDKEVNKSFLKKYENDDVLKDMITTLGYDFEKFWYLVLFINDYSYCACKKETEFFKSTYEYLEDIYNNVGEEGAELTIRIKGKKKVEITEHRTLDLIKKIVKEVMDLDDGKFANSYSPQHYTFNIVKENSDSYTIWYFTTMFLMFFELIPPNNIRRKKDDYNSYSKKLLISRLVYLVGLSSNESFLDSEYTINGFLKQYKTSSIFDKMVIDYL